MQRKPATKALTDAITLRRVATPGGRARFYRLTLQPDLFGGVAVVREWGRAGSPGQVRYDRYPDDGQARAAFAALARQKQRRGYGDA